MMARLFRIGPEGEEDAGKSEEMLNKLGIAVRKNNGDFRSFDSILKDVKGKWSEWGSITQNNVAQTVAGTYHYSKMIGLMDNFKIAVDATNTALHSEGSALNENAKRMDSIEGKMGTLKATIESVWGSMLTSSFLKGFIDGLTAIIKLMGDFNTILVITASLMVFWKGNAMLTFFQGLPAMLKSSTILMTMYNDLSLTMALRQAGLLSITQVLTGGIYAMGNALKALFLTNPVGWVLLAVSAFMMFDNYLKQAEADRQKAFDDKIRKDEEEISKINEVSRYYKENYKEVYNNAEVKKTLLEMHGKLVTAFGEEAKGINLVNGEYADQVKKIDALAKKKREQEIGTLKTKTAPDMEKTYMPPQLLSRGSDIMSYDYKVTSTTLGLGLDAKVFKDKVKNAKEYYEMLESFKNKINNDRGSLSKNDFVLGKLPASAKEWNNALTAVETEMERIKSKYDDIMKLQTKQKEEIYLTSIAQGQFNEKQQNMFDIAMTKVKPETGIEQYQKDADAILKLVQEYDGNIDKFASNLSKIDGISFDDVKKELKALTDGVYTTEKSAEQLEKEMKKADEAFKKSIDSAQVLSTAMKELDENHQLSSKTLEGLIMDYPELSKFLGDEVALRGELSKALDKEIENQKISYKEKLMLSDKYYDMVVVDNKELVDKVSDAYGIDVKNFSNASIAKQKINQEILKSLAIDWKNFWGTEAQAMSDIEFLASGKQGPTQTNVGAFISPEQMEKIKNAEKLIRTMEENAQKVVDGIKFSKVDTKDVKGNKSDSPADKNPENYKNEKDDLFAYKQAIDEVTNAIEANQAEQKKVSSFTQRIELLRKEIELLKQKKLATNNLAWEERELAKKERAKLENPETYGLKFNDKGIYDTAQYESIVDSKVNSIKNMKSGDKRDAADAELENFKNFAAKYIQLRTQYQKDLTAKENLEGDIIGKQKDIEKTEVDELFKNQEAGIADTIHALEKLKSAYEGLSDTDFKERINTISLEMEKQKTLISDYTNQIDELGVAWNKANKATSVEEKNRLHEKAEKLRTDRAGEQKDYGENQKLKVQVQVEEIFYTSGDNKEKYERQKKNLELQGKSLEDNDAEGKEKNRQAMIDLTTAYLKKQSDELKKVNAVTYKAITNTEKFRRMQDELKDSVAGTSFELKAQLKAQNDSKVQAINDVEKQIQDIIKKGADKEKETLDKKLTDYNKYVDDKLKIFDRENATEDYGKDLKVETDKKAEIQKKLNSIMADKSFEGFQKRKELEKEMKDQNLKIDDLQTKRNRELIKDNYADQKQGLADETALKKRNIDEQLSEENIATIARNAMLAKTPEEFEKAMKPVRDNLTNFMGKLDESSGKITTLEGFYKGFSKTFGDGLKILGEKLQTEFLDKLATAKKAWEDINALSGGSLNPTDKGTLPVGSAKPADKSPAQKAIDEADGAVKNTISKQDNQKSVLEYSKIENIKKDIGIYQRRFMEIDADIKKGLYETKEQLDMAHEIQGRYRDGAKKLRDDADLLGWNEVRLNSDPEKGNFQNYLRTSTSNVKETKENRVLGSYANGIDNGPVTKNGLYQLHGTPEKPEWVLNSGQMTNFIKNLTSKFSSNFTVPTPAPSVAGGCGDISVEINIGGNADASTVDSLKRESTSITGEIKKALNKIGIYR